MRNKNIPSFFVKRSDGGKNSGVTAYFLIEWKPVFSVGILHFKKGSREAYHTHAFNALTWWLKGKVTEDRIKSLIVKGNDVISVEDIVKKDFKPSVKPKYTSRKNLHKINAHVDTYALTFRGRWENTWIEVIGDKIINLTHGRKKFRTNNI